MAGLVIILAIVGLLALIALAIAALSEQPPAPPEPDLAAPYREGLHAAMRMQRVARDLEQQIYTTAAQHLVPDAETTAVDEQESA